MPKTKSKIKTRYHDQMPQLSCPYTRPENLLMFMHHALKAKPLCVSLERLQLLNQFFDVDVTQSVPDHNLQTYHLILTLPSKIFTDVLDISLSGVSRFFESVGKKPTYRKFHHYLMKWQSYQVLEPIILNILAAIDRAAYAEYVAKMALFLDILILTDARLYWKMYQLLDF